METLVPWGLGVVQWIQTFRNPLLDQFFLRLNVLGDLEFYILFLPILYWCLDKSLAARLGFLILFSLYLNQVLKDFLGELRPYVVDRQLYAPIKQPGYGFPSAHAQGTTTLWGYLATRLRRAMWWTLAIVIPLLVSIGRMYLGDHYPQDVLAGVALGIVFVALYAVFGPREIHQLARLPVSAKLALAIVVPLALSVFHLTPDTSVLVGTLLGFYVGLILEEEWIRFDARASWLKQVLKFVLGIGIALGVRLALKSIFPATDLFDALRYAVIGLWIGLGAPWLFVVLQLTGKLEPAPPPVRLHRVKSGVH